ncbi:MAG: cysteine--tRNA ligase [Deltaproteobacteria bacterium]|nr:cysteine--tRNA ligase [Deltaproteobacteria bacterium]
MEYIFTSILHKIGNTPLVELAKINTNKDVKIYAKLEYCNPAGSVKDRAALAMIVAGEASGELTREKIVLEATSGNTGIGLALVCANRGYRLCLTMTEGASEERKRILRALGAELILTPAHLGTDGAIEACYNLLRDYPHQYFGTDQFNNINNVMAHYHGTAPEIWEQTGGAVSAVVCALGTTGTAMGISMRLKEYNPAVKIIGVEPYLKHKIQGLKNMKESYCPGIFDRSRLDEIININDDDAFAMSRRLLKEEGLFLGMSSGAAVFVAAEVAQRMSSGVLVVICPDGGERYLSTNLFNETRQETLKVYNLLTKQKDAFQPLRRGEVSMYVCGPTVHDVPHIGSYRRFVVADMFRRYFVSKGYNVRHTMNIIDLADRSIRGAELMGLGIKEHSLRCTETFMKGVDALGVSYDSPYPKASENVDAMLKIAQRLVDKGFAYEKLRSVYFDISKFPEYGVLSNIDTKSIKTKRSVDADNYDKDHPADFALLKRSSLSELKQGVYYKTSWGNVRPSWHLECAAIAITHLGETFDIHLSGNDIVFPHCENVLAIGRALSGKNLANYWLNTELVMVEGKKMSRSVENIVTIDELLEAGYAREDIRFLLLATHYRKPLTFSFPALSAVSNTLRTINGFIARLLAHRSSVNAPEAEQIFYDLHKGFNDAMDDDFNIAEVMAAIFEFIRRLNILINAGMLDEKQRDSAVASLKGVDAVLGVMDFQLKELPDGAAAMIKEREVLRSQKQWQRADEIRQKLLLLGVEIWDTADGTLWRVRH